MRSSVNPEIAKAARSWSVPNKGALLLLASVVVAMGLADIWHAEMRAWVAQSPSAPLRWLSDYVLRPLKWSITGNFLNPLFFLLVPVIFLLERWRPARAGQPFFSSGLVCDALWAPSRELGKVIFVVGWIGLLDGLMKKHGAFLTVGAVRELPWIAQLPLALLIVDFLNYLIHRLFHRVPLLWEFHAVHHSQREVNFLTERRVHFMEFLISATIYVAPTVVLGLDVATSGAVALIDMWHSRFAHMNLRTNLGPLRWILVNPQSHRVHHGVEPRYHNRNFGSMLTLWDQLFGTQEYDWDVYPESGTEDETFPREQEAQGLRFLLTPVFQTIHPFRRIARGSLPGSGARPARSV